MRPIYRAYKPAPSVEPPVPESMGHPEESNSLPLLEGQSTASVANYIESRRRRRTFKDVFMVVSCFAIFAWLGYLTLELKDGAITMRMEKNEIGIIENIVNDVVAAMPSDKNKEVISASVHISEHGVNYQQTITYNPRSQIARVHNPHHLDIDDTVTLMHKPSGMMMMLNNNHKHCEYSSLPDGFDPEMFARASKDVEEEHKTLSPDLEEAEGQMTGSMEVGQLTNQEREDLHEDMQTLCAGLDIHHIKKVTLPNDISLNSTLVEVPMEGGRSKRTVDDDWVDCEGGDISKCRRYESGWGHSCLWLICQRNMVGSGACAERFNHLGNMRIACAVCCKGQSNQAYCKCTEITGKETFKMCQYKHECFFMNKYCTSYNNMIG